MCRLDGGAWKVRHFRRSANRRQRLFWQSRSTGAGGRLLLWALHEG